MNKHARNSRDHILALHPTTSGFGWALFEAPLAPLDWGVASVSTDRNARCLSRIEDLIMRLHPAEIVLEQFEGESVHRSNRIRRLYRSIIQLARTHGIEARILAREVIVEAFSRFGATTRHEIATAIAAHIDALAHQLPPKRKIWLPEKPRMAIFNAAALAITYFALIHGTTLTD